MRKHALFPFAAMAVVILAGAIGGDTFCFFKLVYGVPCPGCGMMRAFAALAGGDLAAALLFHPLVLVVPFLVLVAVFRKSRPFWAMYNSSAFWAACAACFMVVWAVRMFMFFPDFPPMDYSRSSLAWRAVELLCN